MTTKDLPIKLKTYPSKNVIAILITEVSFQHFQCWLEHCNNWLDLKENEELPKEREIVFYTKAVEIVFKHWSNKSKYPVCILIAKNVIYLPKSLVIS